MPHPRWAVFALTCLLPTAAAPQTAFVRPRSGGNALIGPANPHLASVHYNPAVLGLLPGHHVYVNGSVDLNHSSHRLAVVDPATGEAADSGALLPRASQSSTTPNFHVAASSDLSTDSIVLAFLLHTPATMRYSTLRQPDGRFFDPTLQGPGRYHGTDLSLYHLYLTPAAAMRVADWLWIGVSLSYTLGQLNFGFVRDTALHGGTSLDRDAEGNFVSEYAALDDCGDQQRCDYGADRAAEAMRVKGSSTGLGFATGLVLRLHRDVRLGFAYASAVFGLGGGRIPAKGDAYVRRSQATLSNGQADPNLGEVSSDLTGRGTVRYGLPDTLSLGLNWQLNEKLLADLQLRWTNHSRQESLEVRLTGPRFRDEPRIPERVVHHQGFQDTYAVQLGGSYRLLPAITVEGAMMLESPVVSKDAVSPLIIDSWTVDLLAAMLWRVHRYVALQVGYSLLFIPSLRVTRSRFSPSLFVRCVDGQFNVDLSECREAAAGRGLATTEGRYSLWQHRFSVGLRLDV